MCTSLGCEKKPESPKKTHADVGRMGELRTDSGSYQRYNEMTSNKLFGDLLEPIFLNEAGICCQLGGREGGKSRHNSAAVMVTVVSAVVQQGAWGERSRVQTPLFLTHLATPASLVFSGPHSFALEIKALEGMITRLLLRSGDLCPGGSKADPSSREAVHWAEQ